MLPSFNEFLNTLSQEELAKATMPKELHYVQMSNPVKPEEVEAYVKEMTVQMSVYSWNLNIYLLQSYHEWLEKQLP